MESEDIEVNAIHEACKLLSVVCMSAILIPYIRCNMPLHGCCISFCTKWHSLNLAWHGDRYGPWPPEIIRKDIKTGFTLKGAGAPWGNHQNRNWQVGSIPRDKTPQRTVMVWAQKLQSYKDQRSGEHTKKKWKLGRACSPARVQGEAKVADSQDSPQPKGDRSFGRLAM